MPIKSTVSKQLATNKKGLVVVTTLLVKISSMLAAAGQWNCACWTQTRMVRLTVMSLVTRAVTGRMAARRRMNRATSLGHKDTSTEDSLVSMKCSSNESIPDKMKPTNFPELLPDITP
jgi:hypothetical protein